MKAPASLYVRPEWGVDWDGPEGAAAEANELLALISPPSSTLHWLHCYYEPGERWQPVERLVIAEMIPRSVFDAEEDFYDFMARVMDPLRRRSRSRRAPNPDSLLAELEGPNPRDSSHYDKIKGQFVYDGLPPNITQRQWWLWRSHRAYARAFWVIQGRQGGHKKSFTELERKILRFNGRPDEPAWAGQLPFARFDQRILPKMLAMDKLQAWAEERSADWSSRTAHDAEVERVKAKEEIDRQILDWLDSQVTDIAA